MADQSDRPADRQLDGEAEPTSETTPLIAREGDEPHNNSDEQPSSKATRRRWPSLLALLVLCIVAILIIVFAFVAPSAVQQYATQAVTFEPTSLSIDSFTTSGVRARIQGDFTLDPAKVEQKSIRDIGKFCTWIAREVESGESEVQVSLPEYGNLVLGTAHVPPIVVDIRPGHTTKVDFLTDLAPGEVGGIRRIAEDWLAGRLGQLRIVGKAMVPVKSGIFSLGTQTILQELLFNNDEIPDIPAYDIKKLNFYEVHSPERDAMAAEVALVVQNDYPVDLTTPSLEFEIMVAGCQTDDPYIKVAHATIGETHVVPDEDVAVNVFGLIEELPPILTQDCPDSSKSPLDVLLGRYIHGEDNTIYVQGSSGPSGNTPKWIQDLISDIIVPVPVPGHSLGHLIRNFSLADTHFGLPDPFADPNTPEANPRISAKVQALVALPEEMNVNVSVSRVRADTNVYYKGKKLGVLDLHEWQPASSRRIEPSKGEKAPLMMIQSEVKDAPLLISDEDLFADVIQELLFGGRGVVMHIKAEVDAGVETALGAFDIRKIPAEGEVPVKPISNAPHKPGDKRPHLPPGLDPQLYDLRIEDTTPTSLSLGASVDMSNPTEYSASIPYVNIHIMKNGSLLGHATARNLEIVSGRNTNLVVSALYDPLTSDGERGRSVGRELLSQYISGYDTFITLRTHEDSFPGQPWLGRALSRFEIEVPAPRLEPPKSPSSFRHDPNDKTNDDNDDDDDGSGGGVHFISDATFHLFSSTATFLLLSPLAHTTLFITTLNATALYEGSPMGTIVYGLPDDPRDPDGPDDPDDDPWGVATPALSSSFSSSTDPPIPVPPVGRTPDGAGALTPPLPVNWDLGSVGYGAIRQALGGRLRLAAKAEVGVKVGRWEEWVWFTGSGIGAKVRW